MKLKQNKITSYFRSETDHARDEFYRQMDKFQVSKSFEKGMPSVELIRKRFGHVVVNEYKSLLERAEDFGIFYYIDSSASLNRRTCESRMRDLADLMSCQI